MEHIKYIIKTLILFFLLIFLIYIVLFSFNKLQLQNTRLKSELTAFLRYSSFKPEVLKFIDLNFNTLISDYYWALFVQEASSFKLNKINYPYMYRIALITVSLNKRFNYAYQASGTMLGLVKKPHRAIKLLKMGLKYMGSNWNIPFLISFNYFYNLGNYKKAAYYLKYAIKTKGSPKYLEFLYVKLLNGSKSFSKAKVFLEEMYKNNKNPYIRRVIKNRIDDINKEIAHKEEGKKLHIPYGLKIFINKH